MYQPAERHVKSHVTAVPAVTRHRGGHRTCGTYRHPSCSSTTHNLHKVGWATGRLQIMVLCCWVMGEVDFLPTCKLYILEWQPSTGDHCAQLTKARIDSIHGIVSLLYLLLTQLQPI
jgi:hypothetical protein